VNQSKALTVITILSHQSGTDHTPYATEVIPSVYDVSQNNPVLTSRLPGADRNIGRAFYYFTALNAIVNYMNILGDPSLTIPTGHSESTTTTTITSTSSETHHNLHLKLRLTQTILRHAVSWRPPHTVQRWHLKPCTCDTSGTA
jgi:hypothetical protein